MCTTRLTDVDSFLRIESLGRSVLIDRDEEMREVRRDPGESPDDEGKAKENG